MKTLAIRQPWVSLIAEGDKTIEVRSWLTTHRGPLLLVASGKPLQVDIDGHRYTLPAGCQVCTVELVDCRPLTTADLHAACLDDVPDFAVSGQWAWVLRNPRNVIGVAEDGLLAFGRGT